MRGVSSRALRPFAGLVVGLLAVAAVPQLVRGQRVEAARGEPLAIAKRFPTLPLNQWVGQKVQFLAAPVRISGDHGISGIESFDWIRVKTDAEIEEETYRHGDVVERAEVTPVTSAPDYVKAMHQALDGKTATVVSVETVQDGAETEKIVTVEVDRSKRRYTSAAYGGTIGNVVFLREVNAARRFFVGKTLRCREQSLLAFRGREIVRVPVAQSAPVVVQDIAASTDADAPLRFLLQARDGRTLFADVHLSGTNIAPSLLPYHSFAATFAETAPQKPRRKRHTGHS